MTAQPHQPIEFHKCECRCFASNSKTEGQQVKCLKPFSPEMGRGGGRKHDTKIVEKLNVVIFQRGCF